MFCPTRPEKEKGAVFADSRACKQFLDVETVSPTRLCRRKRGTTKERTNGAVFWGMAERRHLLPASLQAPGFASKQPIPYIEWEAVGWNAGGGQISAVLEKKERMTQGMCEKSGTDGRTRTRNDGPARPLHSGIEMFPSRLRYGLDRRHCHVRPQSGGGVIDGSFHTFPIRRCNEQNFVATLAEARKEGSTDAEGGMAGSRWFRLFSCGWAMFCSPSLPPSLRVPWEKCPASRMGLARRRPRPPRGRTDGVSE